MRESDIGAVPTHVGAALQLRTDPSRFRKACPRAATPSFQGPLCRCDGTI